jgi:HSP20 family protein
MSSSFLDRLKKKAVIPTTPEDQKKDQVAAQAAQTAKEPEHVADQLHVDIFKTEGAILVYAQIAGASVHDYSVLIEGDGDVVTIKGERRRPDGEMFEGQIAANKEKVLEECSWGSFYRQIILPAEVDAEKTQAKMHEGVLMLLLPLKKGDTRGVKIEVKSV